MACMVLIAVDQLCKALSPSLDRTLSYADETLSARSYCAHRDGKVVDGLRTPANLLLFCWQCPCRHHHAFIHGQSDTTCPTTTKPHQRLFFSPASRPAGGEGSGGDCKEQHP